MPSRVLCAAAAVRYIHDYGATGEDVDSLMASDSPFPCPPASSLQTLVDDGDPRIIYSEGWAKAGNPMFECEGTTHGSQAPNVTATLNFSGVGVQVVGTVGIPASDGSPSSTYQVDDLPTSTFVFTTKGQANYRIQFYSSPLLNAGDHKLVITSLGNDNSRIWLDYILYYAPTNVSASISSTISMPTASTLSMPTSSTSSMPLASISPETSTNVGAITGGVLGSALGIILGAFISYIILRRKHKNTLRTLTGTLSCDEFGTAIPTRFIPGLDSSRTGVVILPRQSEHLENTTTTSIHPSASCPQEAPVVPEYLSPPSYRP
ncbi:hypothetical protein BDP27DRAFT_1359793 [Rhodocollybia butyracea]|uniref:Uncharacterized protein n=1 Tax=Rhodocollybia butyracea TaxID=206335 RepID=A0A9P5Q2K7_9AGAR|nr:hypothetical protein BDP27DRAFT_1359793 [Rhodocollybia butyracea]